MWVNGLIYFIQTEINIIRFIRVIQGPFTNHVRNFCRFSDPPPCVRICYNFAYVTTLNDKSKADIIYFYFAKAFNSVSHDMILHKLKYDYKVGALMLRFLRPYLQGRQQQVVVGGCTSTQLPVLSGVPEGPLLGCLLFV